MDTNNNNIRRSCIQLIHEMGFEHIQVSIKRDIAYLEGGLDTWEQVVTLCHALAKIDGVRDVVHHIKTPESQETKAIDKTPFFEKGEYDKADLVIIGGGISGCAIARTLSKYNLDIIVVEKEEDLCEGTTKANNGMIHSGYDSKPHTLKARLCVEGNALYTKWAKELDFELKRTGSFVCGFNENDREIIQNLYENGVKNKVPNIEIINGEKARQIEPELSDDITCALWTPSAGYVEPYTVTLALAENAVDNGVRFFMDTEVLDVLKEDNKVTGILTNKGIILTKMIINAAGLYADEIAKFADDEIYSIHPRKGTIVLFDKEKAGMMNTFAGKAPSNFTKGGGVSTTPEGILLWGPSAKEVPHKNNLSVDTDEIEFILDKGLELTKNIGTDNILTYFSGNRAATFKEDFVIENSQVLQGFMHVAGIQSPGLAAAPAIANMVEDLFLELYPDAVLKKDYNPIRKIEPPFRLCSLEEQKERMKCNPTRIICRCETITEVEIVKAIHGKIPAVTMDAIKRRTRAGMGRCQSGFCGCKVLDLLARELKIPYEKVTLKGKGSEILIVPTRDKEENRA